MRESVVIIGAGLGGLFAGAILAKEGLRVTVLEKNATIGGGLQSFRRFGETFDTGMHVVGGMHPGGNIHRLCRYLGILDKVRLRDVDDDCTDRLFFAEDGASYTIAKGREGFVSSLAARFPGQRASLERYADAVLSLADHVDLFNLRPSQGRLSLFTGSDDFMMAADDFIIQVKRTFGVECAMCNELLRRPIRRVALCGGAGDFLLDDAVKAGADAFITGEMHYHQYFGYEQQLQICVIGHYQSEQFTTEIFEEIIRQACPGVKTLTAETCTNPIYYL